MGDGVVGHGGLHLLEKSGEEQQGGDERQQNSEGEEVAKDWGEKGADDAVWVDARRSGLEVVWGWFVGCVGRHDGTCLGESGLVGSAPVRMLTCKQMRGD